MLQKGREIRVLLLRRPKFLKMFDRNFADLFDACTVSANKKGLVLGAYGDCGESSLKLSITGQKFDNIVGGRISQILKMAGLKPGTAKTLTNLGNDYYAVAVAHAGAEAAAYNENECLEECKENVRVAAGAGARALQEQGIEEIEVEGFNLSEAAAEGSALAVWRYQELKNKLNRKTQSTVELYDDDDKESWSRGLVKAEAQNLARLLEECPANIMTPEQFVKTAVEVLCPCGVQVEGRNSEWLHQKGLCAFLSMARGSFESPLLLELNYCGGSEDDRPVVLVGKGVTFDSGGLCLKSCDEMAEFRADMAGGAVIVGVMKALATLGIPLNVTGMIPLCENMPGGMALKPGDIVYSLNGSSIKVENTDKEGQVIMADVLCFTKNFKPCLVSSLATISRASRIGLGSSASGVFCTSDVVWHEINRAGAATGDRVWRLPLWRHFTQRITSYGDVDISNVGSGRGGDPCSAAAFLQEFAPDCDFMHIDMTGSGMCQCEDGVPYLRQGLMTGRPCRTVVEFLYQMACPLDRQTECG
ncbi:manganese ion Hypothetical protein [Nesidiocoris tenuis]|uniref:Cytosol aminopeptidase n=1 Tax=Nesidiocoris tenuis TaxID=355587 RepID=A0ABN7BE66_9HEMI|nr:manganese ion Hypothetical protein [Nesidiocoris tenuis]